MSGLSDEHYGLSSEQLEALAQQLKDHAEAKRHALPGVAPLLGWEKEAHDAQQAKMRARVEADQERQRQIVARRQELESERQRSWEANAEVRGAARRELEELTPAREVMQARTDAMLVRERELREEVNRWAPSRAWESYVDGVLAAEAAERAAGDGRIGRLGLSTITDPAASAPGSAASPSGRFVRGWNPAP